MVGYLPTDGIASHRVVAGLAVAALAAVALSPTALAVRAVRSRIALAATAVLAAGLVLGSGWFGESDDVRTDPGASATSCGPTAGGLRLCVLPGHEDQAAVRAVGLAGPDEYRETSPHDFYRRQDGELVLPVEQRLGAFSVSLLGDPRLDAPLSVLSPPECLAVPVPPQAEERYRTAQAVLGHWAVLLVAGEDPVGGPTAQDFDRLAEREQADFVRAALPAVLACDAQRVPELRVR
jgi:hypothetical protein